MKPTLHPHREQGRSGSEKRDGSRLNLQVPRAYRRVLVAVFIAGTLGGLAVSTLAPQLDALAKALQIVGPLCGAFLFGWSWASLRPDGLDERQLQTRYETYLQAYLILAAAVLILPVLIGVLYLVSSPAASTMIDTLFASLRKPTDLLMALVAFIPLVGLLPFAVFAWREPDPLSDPANDSYG